ncbi:MAG: Deoxycytidine deaminase, partial [Candidatus Roizmanbacteria bacterium GW2011_GWC2_35_12]
GPKILLKLVKEKNLVEGLADRELTTPEGAGFDLRLGELYEFQGGRAFLGEYERETPGMKLIGDFLIATTIEKVNTPLDITINFKPRTTTFRSGLFLRTGNVAPGYCGKLTFAIKNAGPMPVTLEMGCRIVHAQFEWVDGGGNQYRGQWQGGRVTTGSKREKQI